MPGSRTSSTAAERLLELACARNLPAQVHYERVDGTVVTCRVRLLQLTDERILADMPHYLDRGDRIADGSPVTVHVLLGGSRYQFSSNLERTGIPVRLNERQVIRGTALSKPRVLTDSQRRAFLRIRLVSYDPVRVDLARPHPELPEACVLDQHPATGSIVDLSVGGVAVLVDDKQLRSVRPGEPFYLTFTLPDVDYEFLMFGSLRQVRTVESSGAQRLAFAFRPWVPSRFQRDQDTLAKFVAQHQRRLLRRRR